MIDRLLNAELVIADLSKLNPNAFYEIGIRHMAQKPIIHMQAEDEKPPFDVSLYRAIRFSLRRPADLKRAREDLSAQVQAVLAPGYEVENPVTRTRGRIELERHATPQQQVLLEQMQAIQARLEALEISHLLTQETIRSLGPPAGLGIWGANLPRGLLDNAPPAPNYVQMLKGALSDATAELAAKSSDDGAVRRLR